MSRRPPDNDRGPPEVRPWVWSQHWRDLLFLHWRVPPATLRPLLPAALDLDARDGDAWVSLVLFRLLVRPRGLPFLPGLSALVEANLRTYVRCAGRPGICFLSVHADNRRALWLARLLTPMPYAHAPLRYRNGGDHYEFRVDPGVAGLSEGVLSFRPAGAAASPQFGSLDGWLLERYRLFAPDSRGRLTWADVAHPRWVTRPVELHNATHGFGRAHGLDLNHPPDRSHFSSGLRARFGLFRRVEEGRTPVERSNRAITVVDG